MSPISTSGLLVVAIGAIVLILMFAPRQELERNVEEVGRAGPSAFSEFAVNSHQLAGPTCAYIHVEYAPQSDAPWYYQPVTKLTVDVGCLHRTWPDATWEIVE